MLSHDRWLWFFLGAYRSLPDAAIWWCLRTGGGGVLTRSGNLKSQFRVFEFLAFSKVKSSRKNSVMIYLRTLILLPLFSRVGGGVLAPLHADALLDVGYRDPSASLTGNCVDGVVVVVVVKDSSGGVVIRPSVRSPNRRWRWNSTSRPARVPCPRQPGRSQMTGSCRGALFLVRARPARTGAMGRRTIEVIRAPTPPRCWGDAAWTSNPTPRDDDRIPRRHLDIVVL